jgi:hypothetical protein
MNIFDEAIDRWGEASQLNQATEELAETIVAINKYRRYPSRKTRLDLIEECADSIIMIQQVLVVLSTTLDDQEFIDIYAQKISKLKKYLL